jgi:hypothetical protein
MRFVWAATFIAMTPPPEYAADSGFRSMVYQSVAPGVMSGETSNVSVPTNAAVETPTPTLPIVETSSTSWLVFTAVDALAAAATLRVPVTREALPAEEDRLTGRGNACDTSRAMLSSPYCTFMRCV